VSNWEEVENQVISHKADIGLAEVSIAQENKHLIVEPLIKHNFVFFCRSGHPLLKKKRILKENFNRYPFVAIKIPKRLAPLFPGRLFAEEDTKNLIPSVEIENTTLSRQIVAESDAISGAAPLQIKEELSKGVFSIIPIIESWMTFNYGFIFVRDRALSPAAEKYMELVKELEVDVDIQNRALIEKYLQA
jgi:DNA-binding transcriptional LysR family regulator